MLTKKGFALAQALFFMMFLMAMMAIVLMTTLHKGKRNNGERVAVDAYPVASAFVSYAVSSTTFPVQGSAYFADNPISLGYCKKLVVDGLIPDQASCDDGSWADNLTFSEG